MVRSLAQWTKTLSFPSRLSPNRNSKDCTTLNTTSPVPPPTPPRNKNSNCATSRSSSSTVSSASGASSHSSSHNNNNMPITELEQIVSSLLSKIFKNLNKTPHYNSLKPMKSPCMAFNLPTKTSELSV